MVDKSAREPVNLKSKNNTKVVSWNKPSSIISLETYLFTVFILLALILASFYLKFPYSKQSFFETEVTELKTAYSGKSICFFSAKKIIMNF